MANTDVLPSTGDPRDLQSIVTDTVGCLHNLQRKYGNAVTFFKGVSPIIFAFGSDYNRDLFSDTSVFHLASGMPGPKNSAHRRFGNGLFGLNGPRHQKFRRMLMPPFRKEAVSGNHDTFVRLTEEIISNWQHGQTIDLAQEMKHFALKITGNILFGLDDLTTAHAIETVFEEWMELNHANFFGSLLPIESPPGCYERMLETAEQLEFLFIEMLREKEADGERDDILSYFIRARKADAITHDELIGQVHTLFNAAYHTTSCALMWSLFLIAQHPEVNERVLEEVETLGGRSPTPAGLDTLPYLERVIRESLRILPPVVYSPRGNVALATLGRFQLPMWTLVIASYYVTHHLPETYEDPNVFDPDRWLTQKTDPYAYLPFSAGARMCIGAPFANLMMRVALAMIVQRYRITVCPGVRVDRNATLTLGVRDELPVGVWQQDGNFSSSPITGDIHEMVTLPARTRRTVAA